MGEHAAADAQQHQKKKDEDMKINVAALDLSRPF